MKKLTFAPITSAEIQATDLLSDNAKIWAFGNLEYLNKEMKFFGTSSKIEKRENGHDYKFEIVVMYLQPHDKVSRVTVCDMAISSGCAAPCLISSGMLGLTTGQNAATKRTILMLLRREYFAAKLLREIDNHEKRSKKSGVPIYFRLNGTSDLEFSDIISARPFSNFYDYTKSLSRVRKNTLANYDLTFSASMYSKQSRAAFSKAVTRGEKIAIAINSTNLESDNLQIPTRVKGNDFVSFDETDARFLDAPSALGTLSRKGSSKSERAAEDIEENSFFVTTQNFPEFCDIIARA